jgi:glycosyltransferase involved in cell wall biosynthesis
MARSLRVNENNILITSSKKDLNEIVDGVLIDCFKGDNLPKRDKLKQFVKRLADFKPDVIICSEPLTILAARRYSVVQSRKIRIIYDITEWYPSKKNLSDHNFILKWFIFIKLIIFNFWVTKYAHSFIFGESYKSRPYRFLFPGKPFIFTSYYPDLKYISNTEPVLQKGILHLSYSGKICQEKGYGNFFSVIKKLTELDKDLAIDVKIIGWYERKRDRDDFEHFFTSVSPNITLQIYDRQDLKTYLDIIKESDIFLDLRYNDFENRHCLPIKLFQYAASGRPVIFSDLKAIRKEVAIDKFGFLVNPSDIEGTALLVLDYLGNEKLYKTHCANARHLAETVYNWQKIEPRFIKFISK